MKELVFGLLLHHPHILQSLGALDLSKPRIVTPFMSHGHIGSYIRSAKPDLPSIYRLVGHRLYDSHTLSDRYSRFLKLQQVLHTCIA